ncbi:MAG: hypothetical protein GX625_00535 [Clostridiaceae bacterium]|nr:hypothetical protein [Clostridiaceae bacterium]
MPEEIFQSFTSGFGYLIGLDNGWRDRQSKEILQKAWKKHRSAILKRDAEQNREWGKVGKRPAQYFEELEEKYPRLVVGKEMYYAPFGNGPVPKPNGKDIYEDNIQYLSRLDLLYPWEKEKLECR